MLIHNFAAMKGELRVGSMDTMVQAERSVKPVKPVKNRDNMSSFL